MSVGAGRSVLALTRAEVLLLRRNTTVLVTSTVVPLAMTVGGVVLSRDVAAGIGSANLLALLLNLVLGMGVYMTTTLTLTARREDLYLKRLRTGEAGDAAIVLGVLAPVILGGLLQVTVAVVAVVAVGGAEVRGVVTLLAGVLLALLLAVLAGAATTGVVRSTDQADAATLPFFALVVLSCVWAVYERGDVGPHLALPGGALLAAVRAALDPTASVGVGALGLAVLLAWCVLCAVLVRRTFRWEPRR